jgi:hypothetical protein
MGRLTDAEIENRRRAIVADEARRTLERERVERYRVNVVEAGLSHRPVVPLVNMRAASAPSGSMGGAAGSLPVRSVPAEPEDFEASLDRELREKMSR